MKTVELPKHWGDRIRHINEELQQLQRLTPVVQYIRAQQEMAGIQRCVALDHGVPEDLISAVKFEPSGETVKALLPEGPQAAAPPAPLSVPDPLRPENTTLPCRTDATGKRKSARRVKPN